MKSLDDYFELLKQGDENALVYFVNEHTASLSMFAFKIIKDPQVIEEIIGDAFLKLWQQKNKIESIQHLSSFLFKVTRNMCINQIKKLRRQPVFDSDYNNINLLDDTDIQFDIIYSEFIQILYKELDKLPQQQAKVFKLSYLDGRSTEEICNELKTTPSAVYFAKSKALGSLRDAFKKHSIFTQLFFLWIFLR